MTERRFRFIDTGTGKDVFFHRSALGEIAYDDLREGQTVSFTKGMGPKGPRAEDIKLI